MSASLSILSSSSCRPTCGRAYSLPRRPSPPRLLPSVRPLRPKPSSSPLLQGFPARTLQGFLASAARDGNIEPEKGTAGNDEVADAKGPSLTPERFQHLTKEVPERPVRWPWLIAPVFLVYAWRAVLWELSNWKNAAVTICHFVGYLLKLLLALVFCFIGPPVTAMIWCCEFALNLTHSIYSSVLSLTLVPELLWIIVLTSAVIAIAEATFPKSGSSQPYLLTLAGLLSYVTVGGAIPDLLFWLAVIGMFCYSRFIKKRDGISAALPSAAVLVAIGEPWVRGLTMAAYLSLSIIQHSNSPQADAKAGRTLAGTRTRAPVPLLLVALAIGIHLAARWVRYRHLTWMIV